MHAINVEANLSERLNSYEFNNYRLSLSLKYNEQIAVQDISPERKNFQQTDNWVIHSMPDCRSFVEKNIRRR